MKRHLPMFAGLILFTGTVMAQGPDAAKSNTSSSTPAANTIAAAPAITASSTPLELARAALAAQGGDKFKHLKSMMLVGSADLFAPNSAQSVPGKFAMVTAGDKVRIDIDASPIFKFKQVYDGQQSYSSIPGITMPPASRFGLPVLAKFDQPGYTVSALPDKKKLRGFRVVDAEGNTTDFYVDLANGRVMMYLIPYNGYMFGTENSKFREVDGVLIPISFSQRLESPQGAFFAEYKVKDVKLNQPIADDVFVLQ
jgi:hypothetical protein